MKNISDDSAKQRSFQLLMIQQLLTLIIFPILLFFSPVSQAQNVGIGTTTPQAKLDVNGQIRISGGSPGVGKVLTSDALGIGSWMDAVIHADAAHFTGNGATASPLKLSQMGASSAQVLKWNGTTWAPAQDAVALPFYATGTSNSPLFSITNLGTSGAISTFSSGNYGIWGESGGLSGIGVYGANKLTSGITYGVFGDVYSSSGFSGFFQGGKFYVEGNSGIGTQNPGAKLEVAGQVKITGGSPGSGKVLTSDGTGLASWQTPQSTWLKNGPDIYYNSGNVAIGTNFPRYNLTIYHDNNPLLGFYNSTSGTTGSDGFTIGTYSSGSPVWIWNWENSNMHFATNNANRMIINADGHVSMMKSLDLNTESTFGALYAKGQQALWSDGTYFSWGYGTTYNFFARPVTIGDAANHTSYMLYVNGNAYTTGSWGSSDMRFKKNISSLDNPLDKVLKLRGVSFEFRNDQFRDYQFAQGKQLGFIAQELEKEFPEVVRTESDGYKSVNYNAMIPVLLEAIKALKKQNEMLEKENIDLKARIERIEKILVETTKK